MTGIFYDPYYRRLRAVHGEPVPGWRLVTHNLGATSHQCRRIMREWLDHDELLYVDWHIDHEHRRSA
ncbi:MAG: hypothetical protein U5Q44_15455 [Dehalococcoidia bacterium]|nr:hypothetical protein [Dehalococcoidia bacterium]